MAKPKALFGGTAGKVLTDSLLPGHTIAKGLEKKKGGGALEDADRALAEASMEYLRTSRPTRQMYFRDLGAAIRGFTPDSLRAPTQRGLEAAGVQGSRENQGLEEQLAMKGLTRTPAGIQAQASTEAGSRARTGLVPVDILQMLTGTAPNAVLGAAQTSQSGLSNVADIAAQKAIARGNLQAATLSSVGEGVGGLAAAGANFAQTIAANKKQDELVKALMLALQGGGR